MSSEAISSEENKAIDRRVWQDLFNGQNLAQAGELVTEYWTVVSPGILEDEVRGPDGLKYLVEEFRTACPDFSSNIIKQEAIGSDEVMTWWTADGNATGPDEDESSASTEYTDAAVHWAVTCLSHFSNGKIDKTWMAMVVRGSGGVFGEARSAGEPQAFMDKVVGEGESLEEGEEYYRFRRRKPLRCRCCACICCH